LEKWNVGKWNVGKWNVGKWNVEALAEIPLRREKIGRLEPR
jgi:hypothetical protein